MVIQVYCAATGEPVQQENIEQYKESVLELDATKKIIPFRLVHDETTQFLYQTTKLVNETSTPLNSQPATLDSLVHQSTYSDVQSIYERIGSIVNEAQSIYQVTENRLTECEEKRQKRSIIQLAKETLISFIRDKTFKNYCDLLEEQSNAFSSNSQFVSDISFETIKDELTQNRTVNNCDLMSSLKLDEKALSSLVTNVKSQQQMINMNQTNYKNYIPDQLKEISSKDDEQVEELSSLLERIRTLVASQRERIQNLLSDYESVRGTNDDLQYYSFEYQARNLHQEILDLENKTRENQCLYLLKDYDFRVLMNQQMSKVCERTILILLMMRFFTQSREGGALDKFVFLSKLPDINQKMMTEITNRRENFAENILIRNFTSFTESIKISCEEENQRRDSLENNIISTLSPVQIQELRTIVPGIIGERIPVDLIIEGLKKFERSVSRTIDSYLPQSNSSVSGEENDFFLISKPSDNFAQSTHDLSNMTVSALIDYTDRKTDEQSNQNLVFHDNELVSETNIPSQLYQSVVSEDYSQLQHTINSLRQEIETLGAQIRHKDEQIYELISNTENLEKQVLQFDSQLQESNQAVQLAKENAQDKTNSIEALTIEREDLLTRLEQMEREKLISSSTNSESVSLLQDKLSQVESSKKDLQEKFIKMASEFSKIDQIAKDKNDEVEYLQEDIYEKEKQIEILKKEIVAANDMQEGRCMELILSTRRVESLETEVLSLRKEVEDSQNELTVVKEERLLVEKQLRNECNELEEQVQILNERNTMYAEQLNETRTKHEEMQGKYQEAAKQVDSLFKDQDILREFEMKVKVSNETIKVLQENISNIEKKSMEDQMKVKTSNETIKALQDNISNIEKKSLEDQLQIKQLKEEVLQLTTQKQQPPVQIPSTSNEETEKLKREVKELTIKAQMYETATLKSATAVTTLQKKLQDQQIALKEQEESFKLIQEQYSQLEKSYAESQNRTIISSGKTFVSLEPELNDIVIFFKGNNKDIFTAISKNSNRIIIAPESIETLKQRYADSFDKLNIVVGKIVYLEQANSSYNPYNLNTAYSTAFIEELL